MMKRFLVAVAILGLGSSVAAKADVITFTGAGTGGDGAESASATITTGSNSLTVSLSSLINNPISAGQEVSGIFITLSNTPTSSPTFLSESGTLIDLNSVTTGSGKNKTTSIVETPDSGSINHWGTSLAGSTVCLETAGSCAQPHKPVDLIIGSGPYTSANPSITGRNPQIQDTGTFILSLNGVTAGTMVTSVTFEFGTGPDDSIVCNAARPSSKCTVSTPPTPPVTPTPEPSSLALLGTGVLGLAGMVRRRFGRA